MKKLNNILYISLSTVFLSFSPIEKAYSQTKISSLLGSHMVLQQNTEVSIWGNDKPNTKITITSSWGQKSITTTNANGEWRTSIKTTKAGGPYTLNILGSEKISLEDILLGEVWLCSGQSNMEMPLKGFAGQPIQNAQELITNSTNTNLRLFHVKRNTSKTPLFDLVGTWKEATPLNVMDFSAVAYLYGKILQEKLNVPIGIICSSVGGTRVEAWTNNKTLKESDFDFSSIKNTDEITVNSPSVLFNAMINPLTPFNIKGVIWYQGESNRNNATQYQKLFMAMINSWRKEWGNENMPFYFTQIAPFEYNPSVNAAFLREAQLRTLQNTKNTGMAVTLDIGEKTCIHPAKKIEVAQRLSYWALAKTYGINGIPYSGPIYKSMKVTDGKIELDFEYAPNGISNFGKELKYFTIAGEDQIFYPAKAELERGKLKVSSQQVAKPVAVRYAWENFVEGNIFNVFGLPASSFRTDNWDN
ncbi:Sialate O-acetylesterase [Pseudopedobacter saltans DSM 12145]|uniref:Sialate O-acetylesterase n=1 Tax=Pseudopedobacter saltans (strain ATCC 51119 / DSM 12145 / JCM 21818 / CCUG 39354 / LMG 10337 / NBRC 100064 / NCIMB 13643) TaxID=762903 RepID=F0SEX3_PSESL|nr:sialate O-acetylesterase [Pseudopedobacter saltans]ADY53039.1 Sialate O-acetylesterase [Pseudopedobacter saltans DSM 12145]